jgi:hypothetical protein
MIVHLDWIVQIGLFQLKISISWSLYWASTRRVPMQDLGALDLEPGLQLDCFNARDPIELSSDCAPAPITQGNLLFFEVFPCQGEYLIDQIHRPAALG